MPGSPGKVPAIFTTLESTRSDGDVPASNLAAISVTRSSISWGLGRVAAETTSEKTCRMP